MSQKAVEGLLGRLITDKEFRRQFYQEPVASCARESLEVTARELEALLTLEQTHIEDFARGLDPKIVRATVQVGDYFNRRARNSAAAGPARASGTK